MICSFPTDDNIYKHISYMGNSLTPYSIAISDETFFILTPHFKFIKRHRIDNNEKFFDFFVYQDSNCGNISFKKLRKYIILSNFNYYFL